MPLLASAVGCSKEDIVPAAESATRFTLRVCPEATQAITRAADERAVKDINVFLFDPQGIRPSQHFYVQGGVLERSIPAGRYDVYAVANLHEDMGPMSRKTLSAYEFRVPRSYTSLPMSGYAECTVGKGMPAQRSQNRLQHLLLRGGLRPEAPIRAGDGYGRCLHAVRGGSAGP